MPWSQVSDLMGPPGQTGSQGPPGPQGVQGVQGVPGPQGPAGVGLNMKGTVATSADLPTTGNQPNDTYTALDTGHAWTWDGTQWVDIGPIQGPEGPVGPAGPVGPTGENAYGVLTSSFIVPPLGQTATVTVDHPEWMVVGQMLTIGQTGGDPATASVLKLTAVNLSTKTITVMTVQTGGLILASATTSGLMARGSGNASDYYGGDNATHALPVIPTIPGPASTTAAGLLNQISGNPGDYCGGDNAFHKLTTVNGFIGKNAAYTLTAADSNKYIICTGGSWALTLPTPVVGLCYNVRNDQGITGTTGTITLAPSSGSIDGLSSLPLLAGQECLLICDGSNWRTFGRQRTVTIGTVDVAAAVANVQFLLPLGYRFFEIDIDGFQPATNGSAAQMLLSVNGGSSFLATGYYDTTVYNNAATTVAQSYLANAAYTRIGPASANRATDSGQIRLKLWPGDAAGGRSPAWTGHAQGWSTVNSYLMEWATFQGVLYTSPGPVNAVQLQTSGGNIQTASITVKGIV